MELHNKKVGEKIKKRTVSLFEIFVLVISIFAFAYFVGDEFRVVNAYSGADTTPTTEECKVGTKISNGGLSYAGNDLWYCYDTTSCPKGVPQPLNICLYTPSLRTIEGECVGGRFMCYKTTTPTTTGKPCDGVKDGLSRADDKDHLTLTKGSGCDHSASSTCLYYTQKCNNGAWGACTCVKTKATTTPLTSTTTKGDSACDTYCKTILDEKAGRCLSSGTCGSSEVEKPLAEKSNECSSQKCCCTAYVVGDSCGNGAGSCMGATSGVCPTPTTAVSGGNCGKDLLCCKSTGGQDTSSLNDLAKQQGKNALEECNNDKLCTDTTKTCVDNKCVNKDGTKSTDTGFLGLGAALGNVVEGFLWAAGVYAAARMIIPMISTDANLATAGSLALGLGVLAGKSVYGLLLESEGKAAAMNWGLLAGVGTAVVIFALVYRHETQEIITFNCLPWQAATKGNNCHFCNEQGILPCTEYQCRSLGQACQLLNKGTKQEKCAWVNQNDVSPPVIQPWLKVLTEGYVYTPNNQISPPDRGVNIELQSSSTKCVKAFTPLTFGINTNEPAMCKLDVTRKNTFDEMSYSFSGGLSLQNHSYTLSLPGAAALAPENITLANGGNYNLYVRCQDANGNADTADFVFKFCVEKGPDTTPPLISGTSIPSGNPIASGQISVNISVYVNEPVEGCKWDHIDLGYENMGNTMDCSKANLITDMNDRGLYTCTTKLDGLKDRQENKFYFRCKDLAGNSNKESYPYSLMGTQPLVIDSVEPSGIVKDATENVKVTLKAHTSAGYSDGKADCYFSSTGNENDYVKFLNTNSFEHSQDLWLPEGTYTYSIKCIDLGGNADTKTASFEVKSDVNAPTVVRVYHEETNLKIITDKPARCVYDVKDCSYNFDKGVEMTVVNELNHYTAWNTDSNFYIKCRDVNGNQPDPDKCTIIVKPFSEY
jgi:hypothetical protein